MVAQWNKLKLKKTRSVRSVKMREVARITRILKLIERIWKKAPDLRLLQLITNCFDEQDLYHIEDDLVEARIRAVYKEYL